MINKTEEHYFLKFPGPLAEQVIYTVLPSSVKIAWSGVRACGSAASLVLRAATTYTNCDLRFQNGQPKFELKFEFECYIIQI